MININNFILYIYTCLFLYKYIYIYILYLYNGRWLCYLPDFMLQKKSNLIGYNFLREGCCCNVWCVPYINTLENITNILIKLLCGEERCYIIHLILHLLRNKRKLCHCHNCFKMVCAPTVFKTSRDTHFYLYFTY